MRARAHRRVLRMTNRAKERVKNFWEFLSNWGRRNNIPLQPPCFHNGPLDYLVIDSKVVSGANIGAVFACGACRGGPEAIAAFLKTGKLTGTPSCRTVPCLSPRDIPELGCQMIHAFVGEEPIKAPQVVIGDGKDQHSIIWKQ